VRRSEVNLSATSATASGEPSGSVTRRTALAFGLSGCASLLEGCGGGGSPIDQDSTPPTAWNVGPLYFLVGSGATWDLSATLPSEVAQGGTFGISPTGAALPTGMTLSQSGILAVGGAAPGIVVGVIFSYAEPNS
jgi:hypothetical protein